MNATNNKFGLGRGLEALLGDDDTVFDINSENSDSDNTFLNTVFKSENKNEIELNKIERCSFQPRTEFDEEALDALSKSVKEKGILQPILVRKKENYDDKYEIVAGERRFLAAKKAGLKTIPAIIRDLSDSETLEIALIENVQRQNLSAIEEAKGFFRLIDEYAYNQVSLAKTIGKSQSYIANTLRLLNLPKKVQKMVLDNKLSAGHVRPLIGLDNAVELAETIVRKGLSVREAERLASESKYPNIKIQFVDVSDYQLENLAKELGKNLGLKIKINAGKKGNGSVTLHYENPAQLSSILDILEKR